MNIIERVIKRLKWEFLGFYNYRFFKSYVKKVEFNVLSDKETIDLILNKNISIARFGDGEYRVMNGLGNGFQKPDQQLKNRLIEVLTSNQDNCLVCIPRAFVDHTGLKRGAKITWYDFIRDNGEFVLKITPHKTFGEASCTRFYIDYTDRNHATAVINQLKQVWAGRDVCIVEGANTKMGSGNDLFNGANSISRIICPATNAYQKYDDILQSVTTNISKDKLILLALGMTATVLAYDLSKMGYQALDIGHVDVEYEWYLMHATSKVPIMGKAVNECQTNNPENNRIDTQYESSIIDRIL